MTSASLTELRIFTLVAAHRSFRRAADELSTSRTALSHAVRSLEQELGTRLLHRTTRSVAPTEAGEQLLQRLLPALRELDDMLGEAKAASGEVVGTLRINAGEAAARWLLAKVVPMFQTRHSRVSLDLVTDGRLVDIVAAGFDAGAGSPKRCRRTWWRFRSPARCAFWRSRHPPSLRRRALLHHCRRPRQIHRQQPRHPALLHRHPIQPVHPRHR